MAAYPTRTKAVPDDDDLVNDTTGIGGDEYYPMDDEVPTDEAPVDEVPTDDVPTDEPVTDLKPGAQALTEVYEHFMDLGEMISRLSQSQEHPQVQKHLDKIAAGFDKALTEVQSLYADLYPDHPPLGDGAEPLPDEVEKSLSEGDGSDGGFLVDEDTDQSEEDDDDPEFLKKRVRARKRFIKRLDTARAWRALVRQKRHSGDHHVVMTKAAEHLEEIGDHEGEWGQIHKAACHYHAKSLRGVCKSFSPGMDDAGAGDAGGLPDEMAKRYRAKVEAEVEKRVAGLSAGLSKLKRELQAAREGR